MIIKGSQRTGSRALAMHLLNAEDNEHIDVAELSGFSGQSLVAALLEIEAVSKCTQAQKPMFSCSFNPPEGERVSDDQFYDAFARVEKKLGLVGQPRAVVFHEKEGRRHAHVVWSRIDTDEYKAINLSHFKLKCLDISKQLYLQYDWPMPQGLIDHKEKQTVQLKLAEHLQLKRQDIDPEELRQLCVEAWEVSDNLNSFKHALEERNLFLAKGDKRGFVVLDHNAKVYSLSRFSGVKVKELKAKLGLPDQLPSVDETKKRVESLSSQPILDVIAALKRKHQEQMQPLLEKKALLVHIQKAERRELSDHQRVKRHLILKRGKEKYRRGLKRFFDKVTGKEKRIRLVNQKENVLLKRKQKESRQMMIFRHNQERAELQKEIKQIRVEHRKERMDLARQIYQLRQTQEQRLKPVADVSFGKVAQEYSDARETLKPKAGVRVPIRRKSGNLVKQKPKMRKASRIEAAVLKRKRSNPRFLKFFRKEDQKPKYKQQFNTVNGEPQQQTFKKLKPSMKLEMD